MLDRATDLAFRRSILATPEDDAPRLIYADWLDEHDDAERAEFIRLQVRLARMGGHESDYTRLMLRAEELRQPSHVEWLNRLPQFPGVHWEIFERGFISAARFDHPDAYFEYARSVTEAAPIQELRLHQFRWPDATRLAESRYLKNIRTLDLGDGNLIANQGIEALMRSKHLTRLRSLKVGRNSLGSAGVRAIAESGYVRNLRVLKLQRNDLYDDGLRYLARSPILAGLQQLDLERTRTGDDGVKELANSKHMNNLRVLDISHNLITDDGVSVLAQSSVLSELRDFYLHGNAITDEGIKKLATAAQLSRLEIVFLRQTRIRDDGALALARSPFLENVRELYLGGNNISDQAGDVLRARFRSRVNLS